MTVKENGKKVEATETQLIQKQLQESIKKFQEVNQVIEDRQTFIEKKEVLKGFLAKITKEENEKSLESNTCKIVFQESSSYRDNAMISISNVSIIKEFILFIIGKIDLKISDLEKKISI